ncbi:hypothetical protein IWX90DRAFT_249573 [Phyllosticta citrichinensis]|uniref:Uncharacterized protein n=1 Tax=Phyllosticta citrichinensis TaxID=1130410 RepID=A0ABR1XQW4_9PEZI
MRLRNPVFGCKLMVSRKAALPLPQAPACRRCGLKSYYILYSRTHFPSIRLVHTSHQSSTQIVCGVFSCRLSRAETAAPIHFLGLSLGAFLARSTPSLPSPLHPAGYLSATPRFDASPKQANRTKSLLHHHICAPSGSQTYLNLLPFEHPSHKAIERALPLPTSCPLMTAPGRLAQLVRAWC